MRKFLLGIVLVVSIGVSSCSLNSQSNLYQAPGPWPNGRMTTISMGGAVVLGNLNHDLIVILDNEYLPKTRDVVVSATEFYESYLIETSDPSGRYLPSIQVVQKDSGPLLKVESLQTDRSSEWTITPLGELEILPLTHSTLGTTTLGDLPNLLLQKIGNGGVNVLLPVGGTFVQNEEYEAFQSSGSMTVVLLPLSFTTSGGSGLMSPVIIEGIPWFSISTEVVTMQSYGISEMIRNSSDHSLF
ncbi:MAG: hypothetical protein KAH97_02020 [Anaerolineales bacterium]|nr:hypothetical protein [Anaerolineales bacterium]